MYICTHLALLTLLLSRNPLLSLTERSITSRASSTRARFTPDAYQCIPRCSDQVHILTCKLYVYRRPRPRAIRNIVY